MDHYMQGNIESCLTKTSWSFLVMHSRTSQASRTLTMTSRALFRRFIGHQLENNNMYNVRPPFDS